MTVLERLKELDAEATKASESGGPVFMLNIQLVYATINALPHLLAVAEAAKAMSDELIDEDTSPRGVKFAHAKLHTALAALTKEATDAG